MTVNRMHETVTKLPTDFGKLYLHVSWDVSKPSGFSISHQQRDFDSEMVKALDALSVCLNKPAMLRNPGLVKQIADALHEAVEKGP